MPLPTYPFERRRHWIEATGRWTDGAARPALPAVAAGERLLAPSWLRARDLPAWPGLGEPPVRQTWLLFCDSLGVGERLAARLEELGQIAFRIEPGESYARTGDYSFPSRSGRSSGV